MTELETVATGSGRSVPFPIGRPLARNDGSRRIAVVTTGHAALDDRVYYKEVRSLVGMLGELLYLAQPVERPGGGIVEGVRLVSLGGGAGLAARLGRVLRAAVWIVRNRPVIVHFHDPECLLFAPIIRVCTDCRIIYDCHEVYPETLLGSERFPLWLRPLFAHIADSVERNLAHSLDAVIGTDPDVVERFQEGPMLREVIYNFPPLDLFPPPDTRGEPRARRPVLLYQGGMGVDRGLFVMIEAMPIIIGFFPDAILRLVGPMEQHLRSAAAERVRQLGLEGAVELLPPVSHLEIPALIRQATVGLVPFLLTPKWKKNVPIKQFEYMACGVPVLATDVPPVSRFVRKAGAGIVVTPGDSRALAEGAVRLLADEAGRRRMGAAGRRWVEEEWNWCRMEERLCSLYETLLKDH